MHVLGIDAGGTKTVCFLADGDGRVLSEGRAGGANLQAHGELEVEKALHAATEAALGDRPPAIDAVCLGMAGVDRADDLLIVRGILRRLGFRSRTLIVNDARVALAAGCPDGRGVVLISGTGSICYGVNQDGVAARSGGWGFVLADEGSGYWIGKEALRAVMRASDGRGPETRLTALVLDHFGLPAPEGLVREVYDGGLRRHAVAELGRVVSQAHTAGDAVASEILSRAALELAKAAESVVTRLGMRGAVFPVVLAGGMFKAIPWLPGRVAQLLAEVAPRCTASTLDVEPAAGAVRLAIGEAQGRTQIPPYIDSLQSR